MTKYRIVTSGEHYRVQWFGKIHFWQRAKWRWFWRNTLLHSHIAEFDTREKAEKAIDELQS